MTEQAKRERVVKALACNLNFEDRGDCESCGYPCSKAHFISVQANLVADALAMLQSQEPDETRLVRHYSRPNVYADLWLHCEKCGGRVDDRYKPKFCPECGRKVKWNA